MPPRDSRTVSDVEAEKKAARRKRVKVRRAKKRVNPVVQDLAAVESIFLPNELTGGGGKGKGDGPRLKPGTIARERRGLSLGVNAEDKKIWERQPDQDLAAVPKRRPKKKTTKLRRQPHTDTRPKHYATGDLLEDDNSPLYPDFLTDAARYVGREFSEAAMGGRSPVSRNDPVKNPALRGTTKGATVALDVAIGPEIRKALTGREYSKGWAGVEVAGLLPFATPFRTSRAAAHGVKAGVREALRTGDRRALDAAYDAAEEVYEGKSLVGKAITKRPSRTRAIEESVQAVAAARARTGQVVERGIDKARPAFSTHRIRVPFLKSPEEVWARDLERGLVFDAKRKSLPAALAEKSTKPLNTAQKYALYALGTETSPEQWIKLHADELKNATDKGIRAAHEIHIANFAKARKYVTLQGDEIVTTGAKGEDKLLRAYNHMKASSEARDAMLLQGGYLDPDTLIARRAAPGRVARGARWTPEEQHAWNVIRGSRPRQQLAAAMEESGVDPAAIEAALNDLDHKARAHWSYRKSNLEKQQKTLERRIETLQEAEEVDEGALQEAMDELVAISDELDAGIPYDELYQHLANARHGIPEIFRGPFEDMHPGARVDFQEALFSMPPEEVPNTTPAVTREALQAKHQGDLPDRVDSVSIADEILSSGMKLPAELREPGVLAARIDEIYENVKGGTDGRFWYDTARRVADDIAGRYEDLTADQVAQVIAIYSQAADTVANLSFVREAIDQFFEHGEIYAGRFPERQSAEAMKVLRGEPWEGRKRSSFYRNITSDDDDSVTVDRWVTRWFTPDKETPDQFYDAYEAVLQRMAAQLGWSPKEVQAAAWVTSKKLDLARRRPKWTVDQIDRAGSDAYDVGFERYFGEQGQLTQGGRIHPNAKRVANLARKPDGGGTLFRNLRSDNAKTGYAVALGAHEQIVPVGRVDANLIDSFRSLHDVRMKGDKSLRIGVWHNPENSRVYFDISKKFRNREEALAFAREQGQLAIWDFRRGESIPTGLAEDEANRIKVALRDAEYGPRQPIPTVPSATQTPNPSSPTELWDRILEMVAQHQNFTSKTGKLTKASIQSAEQYLDDFVRRNPDHPESVALRRLWEMMAEENATSIDFSISRSFGDLEGLPTEVKMGGQPLKVGASPELRQLADEYMAEAGLPYTPPRTYAKVDEGRATRIADEYERMLDINDPRATPEYRDAVYRSYRAFADETMAQYRALERAGYTFEFYPEGADPYPLGPREAIEDLKQNKHLYVFPSEEGFGMGDDFATSQNPLLEQTDVLWAGRPTTVNDIFRAVHDVFGHGKEGVGFRADGEENAWRSHVAMYSDEAKGAMTSETRGQNSWVNYGPHGETNRNASQADTVYAEQKAGLMPEWTWREGAGDAEEGRVLRGSGRERSDAGAGVLPGGADAGAATGPVDLSSGGGAASRARAIPRTQEQGFAEVAEPLRGQLQREGGGFVHGAHIPPGHPVSQHLTGSTTKSAVSVSENTLVPTETWVHELTHFWQQHFPGMERKLERLLGPDKEDWVEAYMEYVLDLYPQRALPRGVRDSFDRLSAAILKEAAETGGARFVAQGMPRQLAELFDTTLWYDALKGGKLRGAEDFTGGIYTAVERGFPVSLRHPLASTRQRLQSLSGLFQGRTGVKRGFQDPSVKKHFTGRSVESGWIKIASLGKAQYNALLKAIRMDNVQVARAELLKASTEIPTRADDIAVFENPSMKAPPELKRFWETVEQMGSDIDVNQLSLKEVDELDQGILERIHQSAFPADIDGQPARAVAQEIIEGLREPIEGIRWISSEAFHASELFSAPTAFYNRSNTWGRMEALGYGVATINDLIKLSLLPLNPAYAPMNLFGNLMLNLMQQGPFAVMNLPRAAFLAREIGPDAATAIDYYMGRGIMHLGETELIGRNYSATMSNALGIVVDLVPRRAAFLHEAWSMGFRSGDDVNQLLGNEAFKDELYEVVQRANDAIIDYERLSPFERKYLQRIMFIWPWIRGATRFTYRFPFEHPIQAMAFAFLLERQQAMADEKLGERPWYAKFNIPIGEVERFGQTYPLTINPKQLLPFTTPYDFASVLTSWAQGDPTNQSPIEALQPFWPALVASLTGYDTFAQREVGRGPGTFWDQISSFPLRQAIEDVGKSEEELEEAASNRLYPRNRRDTLLEIGLGSLSPTPYNPEKGQYYAAGKRGPTPEERMRDKQEEIRGHYDASLQPKVDLALQTKVEFEHAKEAKRKELGRDDLTDVELTEVLLDIAMQHTEGIDRDYVASKLNIATAGEIRSALEGELGWNILDAATAAANKKKLAEEAKAEGAVVSAG